MRTKRSGKVGRTRTEKEHDLAKTAKLHEQGKTITEIAAELNVSRSTTFKDLLELENRWRKDGILDMQRVRTRQVREIQQARSQAWDAWNKSREPEKEETKEKRQLGAGATKAVGSRETVRTKNTPGQSKFLTLVRDLISLEADLIGTKIPRIVPGDDTPQQFAGGVIMIPAYSEPLPVTQPKGAK